MLALGLDPSLKAYGLCVYNSLAAGPRSKKVVSAHEATLSSTVPVARFMHFRSIVKNLLNQYDIGVVGIESPAYDGGPFSEIHFGLMMFSLEAIFEKRVDCVLFDPTTLKYLIGNAKADKTEIQKHVKFDTNSISVIDNNESDAYCISKFASRFHDFKSCILSPNDLTEREKHVFLKKSRKKKKLDGSIAIKKTAHIFRENSRFFEFSKIPAGDVNLPNKSSIDQTLLDWLE